MLVLLSGAVALLTLSSATALIRGRTWVLNGPDTGMPLDLVPQITAADADSWQVVTALDLPVLTRVLSSLPGLVLGSALVAGALLVAHLLREIARRRSFGPAARLGLGRLSLVLILGGAASAVLDLVALLNMQAAISPLRDAWVREMRDDAPSVSVSVTPSVPVFVIVVGVIAAALLFALSDGARLEKDAEGVI